MKRTADEPKDSEPKRVRHDSPLQSKSEQKSEQKSDSKSNQRCQPECKRVVRCSNNQSKCAECQFAIVSPFRLEEFIREDWRFKHSWDPETAGLILGICLQEDYRSALVEAKSKSLQLSNSYIEPGCNRTIADACQRILGTSAAQPLLITNDEFTKLLEAMRKAVPEFKKTGIPAVLWFQLLMHCHLDVVPLSLHENSKLFPMPDGLLVGGNESSCLYLHAQQYYYEMVQRRAGTPVTSSYGSVLDVRRWNQETKQIIQEMDQLASWFLSVLMAALPMPMSVLRIVHGYVFCLFL